MLRPKPSFDPRLACCEDRSPSANPDADLHRRCDYSSVMRTVLIVDDHASFRSLARTILEADGFKVIGEAADGVTALDRVRTLKPDLVLQTGSRRRRS
jgi:PleD family two-component response regulator